MATVKRFEDLEIWKMAREQANEIFKLTQTEKFSKDFSVKNQINNYSGSVMDCIAEGFERFSNKEFSQFLVIAKGSNGEVRSQLYRAFDLILYFRGDITNKIEFFDSSWQQKSNHSLTIYRPRNLRANRKLATSNIQLPTSNNES